MPLPVRPNRWRTPPWHSRRDCARASTLSQSIVSFDELHPGRTRRSPGPRIGAPDVVWPRVEGAVWITAAGGLLVVIACPRAVREKKELSIADHVRVSRVHWIHDCHCHQPPAIVNGG